jgi:hypothetical protein
MTDPLLETLEELASQLTGEAAAAVEARDGRRVREAGQLLEELEGLRNRYDALAAKVRDLEARSLGGHRSGAETDADRPCYCPRGARQRCSPDDETHDVRGRRLCCPYDEKRMAEFYEVAWSPSWRATPGRRAAMRKRLKGELEEIAQRAADTRGAW